MFSSSDNKLLDQIFNLKFTSKQLVRASKKCEADEKAEKAKIKKAIEKGALVATQTPQNPGLSGCKVVELGRRFRQAVPHSHPLPEAQTTTRAPRYTHRMRLGKRQRR